MPPGAAPFFRAPRPFTSVRSAELRCPRCGRFHVDREEWAWRPHHTHLCEHCDHEFEVGAGHVYFSGAQPFTVLGRALALKHALADWLLKRIS